MVPLVPLLGGGGGHAAPSAPENFEISKTQYAIFSIPGTKFEDERVCFSLTKISLSMYQSHNQFL